MKSLFTLSVCCVAALNSCSVFEGLTTPGEYLPIYLQEPSPLDPPGMEAVRAEARAKYVKEGLYADGETLEVQQGKAYLFNRNPDYYEGASGRMVDTSQAKIISCEGLYYFVQIDDGRKGFLRETYFVNPVKLVSTTDEAALLPLGDMGGTWNTAPTQDGAQTIMTNEAGRAVLIVNKKSDKSNEFEARRREIGDTAPTPATPEATDELPTPTAELPEPAGTFED
jgi:hypothetical protein